MTQDLSSSATAQHFHASGNSPLAKARRWMWWSLPLVVGATAATAGFKLASLAVNIALLGSLFFLVDLFFRNKLASDRPQVTLDDTELRSPLLSTGGKCVAWDEIVSVALTGNQGSRQLQFELAETPLRRNRRNFWNGANAARPTLLLTPFDEATQTALLQAIERRLAGKPHADGPASATLTATLDEEREFQEGLKALAPVPWLTWLLVIANVLIWLATMTLGGTLAGSPADRLLAWGGNTASAVQAGEWWRLISAAFLHSGLMHLAMNMLGLVAAGITVERIYGQRLYAIIYLGAALIGSALSLHFSAQQAVSVGASGAVFGVTGALLVAVLQHRGKLPQAFGKQMVSSLGIFIVYAMLQGLSKPGIDNAAHVGGLLGGCLLAFLLPEKFDPAHFARTARQRAVLALALAIGGSSAIAALAPRAAIDLQQVLAAREQFARAMEGFMAATKTIQEEGKTYSELEQDERSRSVHAPEFRRLLAQFEQVRLPDDDPRQPLLRDMRRTTALMLELLEMPSTFSTGADKPQPADPTRAAAIEAELQVIGERLNALAGDLQAKQRPR